MEGFNQFVESLRRLCKNNMVDKEKVIELFESGKITEDELKYILGA